MCRSVRSRHQCRRRSIRWREPLSRAPRSIRATARRPHRIAPVRRLFVRTLLRRALFSCHLGAHRLEFSQRSQWRRSARRLVAANASARHNDNVRPSPLSLPRLTPVPSSVCRRLAPAARRRCRLCRRCRAPTAPTTRAARDKRRCSPTQRVLPTRCTLTAPSTCVRFVASCLFFVFTLFACLFVVFCYR